MEEAGNFPQTQGLPFTVEVLDYFKPWVTFSADRLEFSYTRDKEVIAKEIYSKAYSSVPISDGIWLAAPVLATSVAHLFLFYSAIEALSFFSLNARYNRRSAYLAFAAIGLHPTKAQLSWLKNRFSYAKIHLVFGRELPSRILDCKAALWTKGLEIQFYLLLSCIYWRHKERNYYLPEERFSLFQFEHTCGIRLGIRTHKPPSGFNSYLQFLQFRNPW